MRNNILIYMLAVVGLLTAQHSTAKDVYAYSPDGVSIGGAKEVSRIEYDKSGRIVLVLEKGEDVDIDISRFGYLTFRPEESSGIASIEKTEEITTVFFGDEFTVTSESEITEIRVYDVLGAMTNRCAPASCSATVTVNTPGLNIVTVETGGITRTYKIIRKP
ncbi:MAG: T9SS type A sorting domain-containing protein [Muribaculaceae bacterium]|nr:T9SS type A sorting domain-containing protein [Muribaculaceae bacterium]